MPTIYAVQIGDDGPIKIGYSSRLYDRLNVLKGGMPYPVHLLATVEGSIDLERHLHEKLRPAHIQNEWFHPTAGVLAVVADIRSGKVLDETFSANLPPMLRPYMAFLRNPPTPAQDRVREIVLRFGTPTALALALGVVCASNRCARISSWICAGRIPQQNWDSLLALAERLNITLTREELAGTAPYKRQPKAA